ncbi:MAG TPA: hypothetical protein VES67_08400 [Vicinamibacterales bacterium]|nr:hypothetical protein [Vicinamibacterales bacterium]
MRRRLAVTDTTDYFGEFLEEHPGLWPERAPDGDAVDPFSEFGTEIDPDADRWLHVARGSDPRPPKAYDYRHMLAVATVVLTLFTPAGVISTVIVGRELTASPMEEEMWHALPPLPSRRFTPSVDRLIGIPVIDDLPTPPRGPAGSKADAESSAAPRQRLQPLPASPGTASPAPTALMPLTTALLSAPIPPAAGLGVSPAPVRSNPPPANMTVPTTSPPAPGSPSATPTAPPVSTVAPPPSSRTPANPPAESVAVRAALDRYREAFSNLDAGSAKSVWPAVDEKTLARAFTQVSRQEFVFDACNVDVSGPRATASCQGRAQYVPKVGSRTARFEPRSWTFTLRRAETQWTIESVDSR